MFSGHESAFTATVKKAAKQMVSREEITTLRYEDGSLYQGQATSTGMFQGQGTYEIGHDGNTYTGNYVPFREIERERIVNTLLTFACSNFRSVQEWPIPWRWSHVVR